MTTENTEYTEKGGKVDDRQRCAVASVPPSVTALQERAFQVPKRALAGMRR